MSWITRINITTLQAAKERLSDNYRWHQELWKAFSGQPEKNRDFLFRVDSHDERFETFLLSHDKPVAQHWGIWQSKQIANSFLDHNQYVFKLRANPTRKRVVRDENGERLKNGKRGVIGDPEGLTEWLQRKGENGGFVVDGSSLSINGPVWMSLRKGKNICKHSSVEFSGKLSVTDNKLFKDTYNKGIGSAKGFGFGLLLLAPLD
jgi:CRISPR system Cascade subunit CasE